MTQQAKKLVVNIQVQVEVIDADALRAAVVAKVGLPSDELEARLREVTANCIGLLLDPSRLLLDLPGVMPIGSSYDVSDLPEG